jgi:hypothetical protein
LQFDENAVLNAQSSGSGQPNSAPHFPSAPLITDEKKKTLQGLLESIIDNIRCEVVS